MSKRFVIGPILGFAVVALIAAAGPSIAQSRISNPAIFRPLPTAAQQPPAQSAIVQADNMPDLKLRLDRMNGQLITNTKDIAALKDLVAQLQAELKAATATATAAKMQAGFNTSAINALGDSYKSLANSFKNHTHSYDRTAFGWWSQQMHNLEVAKPTQTSPPAGP